MIEDPVLRRIKAEELTKKREETLQEERKEKLLRLAEVILLFIIHSTHIHLNLLLRRIPVVSAKKTVRYFRNKLCFNR